MNKAQAINEFWNGFDLPAYDENTVPDDASLPRITYSVVEDNWESTCQISASLWYRGTSWAEIEAKKDEIAKALSRGGIVKKIEDGFVWIKRGEPFSQRMGDEDDTIRRIYLITQVDYLTEV